MVLMSLSSLIIQKRCLNPSIGAIKSYSGDNCVYFFLLLLESDCQDTPKNGFHIGICGSDMTHSIIFFFSSGQFVLFDDTIYVIVYICTNNKTILCLIVHCLCIKIVAFLCVLYQPSLFLKTLNISCAFHKLFRRIHLE